MNSSNSRRHKWVSAGVGVAPQSQDLVAENCFCFVLLIENILSGNAVLWWLGHSVLCHVSTLNVMFQERFIFRKSLFMNHLFPLRGEDVVCTGRLYPDTVACAWWWEMQSLDSGPIFLHMWNLLIVHNAFGEMKVLGWMCMCYVCAPEGLK